MQIIFSAYVFLALASWSALAAPFPFPERNSANAPAHSMSSSSLAGRQQPPTFNTVNGLQLSEPPMGCNDGPKYNDKHDDGDKNKKNQDQHLPTPLNLTPTGWFEGPGPLIARRRFRSPMARRRNDNAASGSPSILNQKATTTKAPNNHKTITVGDVVEYYLKKDTQMRKAKSDKRPKAGRGLFDSD